MSTVPGQTAYETYVTALDMHKLCRFSDLHPDIQQIWALVEAACRGQQRFLPSAPPPPRLLESNHV